MMMTIKIYRLQRTAQLSIKPDSEMMMTIKIYRLQRTAKLYAEDKEVTDAVKAACRGTTVRL